MSYAIASARVMDVYDEHVRQSFYGEFENHKEILIEFSDYSHLRIITDEYGIEDFEVIDIETFNNDIKAKNLTRYTD
jgi:hypothetical protein